MVTNIPCPLIESDAWTLELSDRDRELAWSRSEPLLSPKGRWQTYLSFLCQGAIQTLLSEELSVTMEPVQDATFSEFVAGTALVLGETKLVIVPTEALEADSVVVPQEWVDLPSWLGDYYVAVQVSPEEEEIRILGYTTHKQLKEAGEYDAFDRTYSFETEELIGWDLFEATYDAYSKTQTRSEAITPLDREQTAENSTRVIERLANPDLVMPRLEIPFAQWGAVLESQPLRQQLYQTRRGDVPALTRLSGWLQEQIDTAWQGLETILPQQPMAVARGTRDGSAESDSMLYRAKQLGLDIEEELALVVGVEPAEEGEVRILLKLGVTGEVALPHEVKLRLLSADGEEIGQASAATTERLQMLFRASPGERFAVEVSSQGQQVIEYFSV